MPPRISDLIENVVSWGSGAWCVKIEANVTLVAMSLGARGVCGLA